MKLTQEINWNARTLDVLRLDLIHPLYGGNKCFKLKYNAEEADGRTILTFGGAHSNHIYSTAALCAEKKLGCVGVIRGREEELENSPTLRFAKENGMKLHFVSGQEYRKKNAEAFIGDMKDKFGEFHLVPEGGNNAAGVKGCTEILSYANKEYDHVFCACGTGATFSGILLSAPDKTVVTGISVLKGENELNSEAEKWLKYFLSSKDLPVDDAELKRSGILSGYHFGGYAAFSNELVSFKEKLEHETGIPLDHIYTSKLFFAVADLIRKGKVRSEKSVLLIHSGGQQGNKAFEHRYGINSTSQFPPDN